MLFWVCYFVAFFLQMCDEVQQYEIVTFLVSDSPHILY